MERMEISSALELRLRSYTEKRAELEATARDATIAERRWSELNTRRDELAKECEEMLAAIGEEMAPS